MVRTRVLIALVLVLGLLTSVVGRQARPYAHAAAPPAISLSPNAVVTGTTSTLTVRGSGFAANSQVTVRYNGGTPVGTATTAADDTFTATATIPASAVPDAAIGRHQLQAADAAGGQANAPLAVVGLRLSTPLAPPRAQVMVGGKGFLPGQPVVLRLGGQVVLSTRADGSGSFADQPFSIPDGMAGKQPLLVQNGPARTTRDALHGLVARTTFTVTHATLTLNPTSVHAGQPVAVHGSGFAANAKLSLTVGSIPLGTVSTDAAGAFGPASLAVPATVAQGRHAVGITGPGGHPLATATLIVQAPVHSSTATPTTTATATPSATHTATRTATHTAVPTATHTPVPSATASPVPSATRTPTRSATRTATRTATHTAVPSATRTAVPTATHTAVPTATHTAVPTATATPVAATVAVSPNSLSAGSSITVSGGRYRAGERVDVQLTTSAGTGALHLAYATADTAGNFQLRGMTVPVTTPPGTYLILAIGLQSARHAQATIQVTAPRATLSVRPTTFAPQDTIQVAGTNFLPNEPVSIFLSILAGGAAVPLRQVTANGAGAFGPITLQVPFGVPAGTLEVVASGLRSNRQATAQVTVRAHAPTLASSATSVKPTSRVTLSGSHFQPGETVAIDLVALSFSTRLATAHVSSAGTFTLPNVEIPQNTPESTASLVATGASSHLSAVVQIKVGALPATLSITPTSLTAGAGLGLSARGYIPGETVVVQLIGGPLRLTLISAVVGTSGAVSIGKITIPAYVPAGTYTLVAAGQTSGRSASTKLTVQAPPPAAPILSILAPAGGTPARLNPGGLVQIAGSHFPANTTVTLTFVQGGKSIALGTVRTAGNGIFGPVGLTVSANTPAGTYNLRAQIGGRSVASVAVQVVALTPKLTVAPAAVKPGVTLTIRGSGFAPGEQVVLALNGAALATRPATVVANGSGAFVATAVMPGTLNDGANVLTAVGASSRAGRAVTLHGTLPVSSRWYLPGGDTTGGNHTTLALLNPSGGTARVTLTFLYQNARERHTTLQVPAHARASVDLALVAGAGRIVSTIVEADRQIGAESTVRYGGGDTSTALGATAPATLWYLAEGYTSNSFSESLVIMNPNTGYATVDVRFLPFNGKPPREARFSVPPRSIIRLDVGRYMPHQSVATIVTADKGVVVERTMRFGEGRRGAHAKVGVNRASTVWLFAQADAAPSRQTFLTVLNPNQAAPAAVTATFYDTKGRPVGSRTIVVDPLRRGNIKVNDVLAHAAVAAVVTSNVPVVVERPQYEGPADLNRAVSGSDVFGRNGGAPSWLLPGGSVGTGSQERIYLFNPGLKAVQIRLTVYAATGASVQRTLSLAANSRGSLDLNSLGGLPAGPVGARLESTNGQVFIAERLEINPAQRTAGSTQGIAR